MGANKRVSMCFDGKGCLVVFDERGKKIKPDKRKLCDIVGDGKVVKAESISVLEIEGSCYKAVYWGGWYIIPC